MMLLFDIKQEMYSPVITRCSLHTAWGARITQYACTSTALQERKNAYSLFVFLQHILDFNRVAKITRLPVAKLNLLLPVRSYRYVPYVPVVLVRLI